MKEYQGSSIHTPRKELEIGGVAKVRFLQYKHAYFDERNITDIICADVFCGTGRNDIQGEIVDGSPLRVLKAYQRANNQVRNFKFWFSDILPEACATLRTLIPPANNIKIEVMAAKDALNFLGNYLHTHPSSFLFLVLDPNGPKDFPIQEVAHLIASFSVRIDVIPYISATAIKRCIGAREKGGINFNGWLGSIENFDDGFIKILTSHGRQGWIRKHIEGDPQHWTMIPTFGCLPPRDGWEKQGLVYINTDDGKAEIDFLSGRLR
jgi:hypothetical protein